MLVWAVRHEMAWTLEGVLARRTRALFLNARAAIEMAPRAADLVARQLQPGVEWRDAAPAFPQVRMLDMEWCGVGFGGLGTAF
jgi:glycerol-3-phosphate dehydrogenase